MLFADCPSAIRRASRQEDARERPVPGFTHRKPDAEERLLAGDALEGDVRALLPDDLLLADECRPPGLQAVVWLFVGAVTDNR